MSVIIWLIVGGLDAPSDFIAVWAAGKLASAGHAASVYDWAVHKLVEQTAVGHPFAGYFGFHYPPTFRSLRLPSRCCPMAPPTRCGRLELFRRI
jgi:hypothetical protein